MSVAVYIIIYNLLRKTPLDLEYILPFVNFDHIGRTKADKTFSLVFFFFIFLFYFIFIFFISSIVLLCLWVQPILEGGRGPGCGVGAFTLALFRCGDPGLSIMKTEPDIFRFF